MKYSDLSEETQLFLNKVMDIYSIIEDKDIKRTVNAFVTDNESVRIKEQKFTKLDKKVMAFFIAGLLVDGNLKEIFSQYDDIKLDNLFDFIGIKESDIIPIEKEKYEDFFEKKLMIDLISIIKKSNSSKEINFITPEVIAKSLKDVSSSGSCILDYFAKEYDVTNSFIEFSYHPIFNALDNYTLMDGSISKKDLQKKNDIGLASSSLIPSPLKKKATQALIQAKNNTSEKEKKATIFDDSVWQLLDEVKKKFIGQEVAAEELFYNIVNNQDIAERKREDKYIGGRSVIFIDGPSGTGKTAIASEISENIGIPFVVTSTKRYSSSGYAGGDIEDLLKILYKKADGDLEKAQKGIIVIDEIEKIAYSGSEDLKMNESVQYQLLDFLGGGKYNIRVGNSIFDMNEVEFDTSKITFICLGALTALRSEKTKTKQTIGFGQKSQSSEVQTYSITEQDLIDIGLIKELVGRFNTYLHTDDYSKESLEKILRESTISPLIGFKNWIEVWGKQLVIDDDVYGLIAEKAYEMNTGARSLETVMNNIRTSFIKEVLRGTSNTIHLDSETVIKITSHTRNRRKRG